jgi:hypothetical protein
LLVELSSRFVDRTQFLFGFRVEAVNARAEGVLNLFARLANAGESAFARIASSLDDAVQFTTGNNIKSGTLFRQKPNHGKIRIGFESIADLMINRGEGIVEALKVVDDCSPAVNIKRRTELLGYSIQIGFFAG